MKKREQIADLFLEIYYFVNQEGNYSTVAEGTNWYRYDERRDKI